MLFDCNVCAKCWRHDFPEFWHGWVYRLLIFVKHPSRPSLLQLLMKNTHTHKALAIINITRKVCHRRGTLCRGQCSLVFQYDDDHDQYPWLLKDHCNLITNLFCAVFFLFWGGWGRGRHMYQKRPGHFCWRSSFTFSILGDSFLGATTLRGTTYATRRQLENGEIVGRCNFPVAKSSPLKINGWKMIFLGGARECIVKRHCSATQEPIARFLKYSDLILLLPVVSGSYKPYKQSYPLMKLFIGVVSLLMTGRGPPCIKQLEV